MRTLLISLMAVGLFAASSCVNEGGQVFGELPEGVPCGTRSRRDRPVWPGLTNRSRPGTGRRAGSHTRRFRP